MAIRKKTSTTRLPQSLLEQVDGASGNDHSRNLRRRHSSTSRKEVRKQERDSRKQKKGDYFSHPQNPRKRPAGGDHQGSPQRKKAKTPQRLDTVPGSVEKPARSAPSVKHQPAATSNTQTTLASKPPKKSVKETSALRELSKGSSAPKIRSQQEGEEDAYISYLEAKLGMKKGSKSKSKADGDSLDDLMDWADSFAPPAEVRTSKDFIHLAQVQSDQDKDDESDASENESANKYEDEEEWGGIYLPQSEEHPDKEGRSEAATKPLTTTGAYVPPQLRNAQSNDSEELQKLSRQLKGLLNRMGEQNIGTIINDVESVYRNHRRNDVTSTITNLIISGISAHSSLLDSYVVLYAAFVSSLHKIIGVEFAAHFVQGLVSSYETNYVALVDSYASRNDSTEQDGKECSNLLVMISELYNFQVISSLLVFDVIRDLLSDHLTEFKVELLLKITRNSGQQLRQDDPSALKDIVQIVQSKVSDKDDTLSSRTRFMIETLTNLKNNKLKRNITQNQGGAAVERMKKFLSGLSKTKHVLAHEPLRVSLEDLHSAESKGKWWLVGAAWGGDPLVDKQEEFANSAAAAQDRKTSDDSDGLLTLARAQGMNTDIRRGIFVVLMSSEDYIDACERLSQLNLTEVQQREIIRVLFHCCGNEKAYNPYYTLVAQQLCRTSHSYKITLQFTLWDFLRDLGETTVGGAAVIKNVKEDDGFDANEIPESRLLNVARAYAWWIAKDSLSLAVLKPIDFTILKAQARVFLSEMFTQIFINSQRSTPLIHSNYQGVAFTRNRNAVEEVFVKASRIQALSMGIVYFLSRDFKVTSDSAGDFTKFVKWAVSVAKDSLRTAADAIPNL